VTGSDGGARRRCHARTAAGMGPAWDLLGIVTALVLSGGCFYYQSHLNAVRAAAAPPSASSPAGATGRRRARRPRSRIDRR